MKSNYHRVWSLVCVKQFYAALVMIALTLIGCSGSGASVKTGTVQGKVLLNGQPLQKGTVFFFTAIGGDSASGAIQPDGTYTARYQSGFSIPVGDYAVSVSVIADEPATPIDPTLLMEKIAKEGLPKPSAAIPEKYTDPKKSGLIAVIKEGANTVDFDLK